MEEFDRISAKALANNPIYYRIVQYKIDGLQNSTIKERLLEEFNTNHSLEYISTL